MATQIYGTDPKLPNYARPEYIALLPSLTLLSDELGGTEAMHSRSNTYIRKWSAEKTANYNIRRKCETFFDGLGRTLSAAIGMLFAKPPAVEWNQGEAVMEPHTQNIDGAGNNIDVFVKRFSDTAIRDGLAVLFVDHPSAPKVVPSQENPEGTITGKMAEQLNLRPLWRKYDRLQAINWLVEVVDNVATLTQLTLVEQSVVRDGLFGVKPVVRFRDLRLEVDANGMRVAKWTLWEMVDGLGARSIDSFKNAGSGEFRNKEGAIATRLPIAIAQTGRSDAPMESTIPLLGVAYANLAHWQLSTSLRFNSEVAGFAQPTVVGELAKDPQTGNPVDLNIGPLVTVQVQEGGEFKWTEAAGSGLERLSLLVQEKLRQIAALGMSFLQTDTRSAETAEAKRLDAAAENATLATAATGIEDAVNLALEIHAWYVGIEKAGAPTIALSRDFESTVMDAQMMGAYAALVGQGFPKEPVVLALIAGGRLPADTNVKALVDQWEQAEEAAQELAQANRDAEIDRLNSQKDQKPGVKVAA